MTGSEIQTCPWRGYSDDVCIDVLEAMRLIGQDGSAADLIREDFPAYVVEGVVLYRSTASAIQNYDLDVAMRKQKRK